MNPSPNSSRICDDGYACLAPDCSCENKPTDSPFAARVDFDGLLVGGHSWLRISLRLPRWYALRLARKRRVIL